MKPRLFLKRDLLWCVLPVIAYAILFPIVAQTRMIEKVMALSFSWWELLLITAFLVARLITYLLVPALTAAMGAFVLTQWLIRRGNRPEKVETGRHFS